MRMVTPAISRAAPKPTSGPLGPPAVLPYPAATPPVGEGPGVVSAELPGEGARVPAVAPAPEPRELGADEPGPLWPACDGCVGGVCGVTVLPDRVPDGGPVGAVGGVCTTNWEWLVCPEWVPLGSVPPECVLSDSVVLGCECVGEEELLDGGFVDPESLGVGELLEVGVELELVGCDEDGSLVEDVGVCEDVEATALGAYAAVTRTKTKDTVTAAQARRAGARMAMLSYGVMQGAGAGPLGQAGKGIWRNDWLHQE